MTPYTHTGAAITIGLAATLALSATAAAEYKDQGRFGFHAKASTLGAGAELSYKLTERVGVRAGAYTFGLSRDEEIEGIDYDLDADILNIGGYLDWHPFGNSFRLTGGVIWNDNGVTGIGQSENSFRIGNNNYTLAEIGSLTGEITTNEVAPYLGIGWGGTAIGNRGFSFSFELGAMFHGNPEARLLADIPADSPLSQSVQARAAFEADLARELDQFQNDIDDFTVYPVISIGFSYRF